MTRPRALAPRFAAQAAARAFAFAAWLVLGFSLAPGAVAQGAFSPAITVNDRAITGYELTQRERLLRALGTPGDLAALAREQLIDDRLRQEAVERAGLTPGPEAVADGITEFAGRADLTAEAFLARLAEAGVARETMEDFVRAGSAGRETGGLTLRPAQPGITGSELEPRASATEPPARSACLFSADRCPLPPQASRPGARRCRAGEPADLLPRRSRPRPAPFRRRPPGGRGLDRCCRSTPGLATRRSGQGTIYPLAVPRRGHPALRARRGRSRILPAAAPWRKPRPGPSRGAAVEYAVFSVPDDADGRAEARAAGRPASTLRRNLYGGGARAARRPVDPPGPAARRGCPQTSRSSFARLDAGETSLNLARDGARLLVMLCDRTNGGLETRAQTERTCRPAAFRNGAAFVAGRQLPCGTARRRGHRGGLTGTWPHRLRSPAGEACPGSAPRSRRAPGRPWARAPTSSGSGDPPSILPPGTPWREIACPAGAAGGGPEPSGAGASFPRRGNARPASTGRKRRTGLGGDRPRGGARALRRRRRPRDCPIHKAALMEAAGFAFPGHTEYLAALARGRRGRDDARPRRLPACGAGDHPHPACRGSRRADGRKASKSVLRVTEAALRLDFGLPGAAHRGDPGSTPMPARRAGSAPGRKSR